VQAVDATQVIGISTLHLRDAEFLIVTGRLDAARAELEIA
jgi:hypothetical protein